MPVIIRVPLAVFLTITIKVTPAAFPGITHSRNVALFCAVVAFAGVTLSGAVVSVVDPVLTIVVGKLEVTVAARFELQGSRVCRCGKACFGTVDHLVL